MLMFGTYSVINIVVLLNLLIAMMNHSYQLISVSVKTNSNSCTKTKNKSNTFKKRFIKTINIIRNNRFNISQERADVEWKFARSKLWISYFEEGGTCPPPFNIIPTPKSLWYVFQWVKKKFGGRSRTAKKEHMRTIRVSKYHVGFYYILR